MKGNGTARAKCAPDTRMKGNGTARAKCAMCGHMTVGWSIRRWVIVSLTLTFLVCDTQQASLVSQQLEDADNERWLEDQTFYDYINPHDRPQGDQPLAQTTELCPPVPSKMPSGSCHAHKCTSDRECSSEIGRGEKCCYNGCVYTCLPELTPPAFLDWIREPRRRLRSGISWLVNGPDSGKNEETCSSTPVEKDADPLLCPRGYQCSIFDPGDPEKGIPNQGTCVPQPPDAEEEDEDDDNDDDEDQDRDEPYAGYDDYKTDDDENDVIHKELDVPTPPPPPEMGEPDFARVITHAHACDLDRKMLLEGHEIYLDGKQCICKAKQLFCTGEGQVV